MLHLKQEKENNKTKDWALVQNAALASDDECFEWNYRKRLIKGLSKGCNPLPGWPLGWPPGFPLLADPLGLTHLG